MSANLPTNTLAFIIFSSHLIFRTNTDKLELCSCHTEKNGIVAPNWREMALKMLKPSSELTETNWLLEYQLIHC